MQKQPRKHKLLLDANIPARKYFPTLNERFDIKHIQEDLKKYEIPDPEVYRLAVSLDRILITYNIKHFRALAGTLPDRGIIGISPNLSPERIDKKLTAFLIKHTPQQLAGKYAALTGETETS